MTPVVCFQGIDGLIVDCGVEVFFEEVEGGGDLVEGVDFEVVVEEGDGEFGVSVVFEGFVVEFVVEEFDGQFE